MAAYYRHRIKLDTGKLDEETVITERSLLPLAARAQRCQPGSRVVIEAKHVFTLNQSLRFSLCELFMATQTSSVRNVI